MKGTPPVNTHPHERPRILLHDPTLRDGHHAVGHQLDADQLRAYAIAANAAGVPVVEVGHGNGLGASSLQIGRSKLDDATMLTTVREALTSSRMGVFMAPGWGPPTTWRPPSTMAPTSYGSPRTAPRPTSPNATSASSAPLKPKPRVSCS